MKTDCGQGQYQGDPIDQSQKINATLAKIPTTDQHKRKIRLLWKSCIIAAAAILVVVGGLVLALFLKGYDSKKIVEVSTTVFQVLVLSYGMGFFVPCLMTSILNMWLGIEMSRVGLELGQQTANILSTLDKAINSRLEKLDGVLEKAEKALALADHPEDHPLVRKFEKALLDFQAEAGKLHFEVKRGVDAFVRPIKAPPAATPAKPEEKSLVHSGESGPAKGNGSASA
jgi:hypothetical protein